MYKVEIVTGQMLHVDEMAVFETMISVFYCKVLETIIEKFVWQKCFAIKLSELEDLFLIKLSRFRRKR